MLIKKKLNLKKIVISLFDKSTNMVKPWADAGYLCYCVDLQHPYGEIKNENIIKVGKNVLDWLPPKGDIVFASFFPPCTDVSVSGAKHFKNKGLGSLIRTLELFKRCIDLGELIGCPYLIENPVSTISTYWRKPDYIFDPCDYGDPYTKKTCLWVGNGFIMPPKNRIEPILKSKMHLMAPSKNRQNLRSETPMGFAQAIFNSNRNLRGIYV